MNAAGFDEQFNRVAAHFHLPTDSSRETVAMEWFRAVEHYTSTRSITRSRT